MGFALFFFVAFLVIIQGRIADKTSEERNSELTAIADSVRAELELATTTSDGYSRSFVVPLFIVGKNYSISLTEGYVSASTSDGKHSIALPVPNVTGHILKGTNVVRRANGTVYLNA